MLDSEASRGAGTQTCDCKLDRFWVRFPLEETKYLILSFIRSGVEAKRAVKFRHSHAMPRKFGRTRGPECINTRLSLSTKYGILHEAEKKI